MNLTNVLSREQPRKESSSVSLSVSVVPRSCLGYRHMAFWAFKRRGSAQLID